MAVDIKAEFREKLRQVALWDCRYDYIDNNSGEYGLSAKFYEYSENPDFEFKIITPEGYNEIPYDDKPSEPWYRFGQFHYDSGLFKERLVCSYAGDVLLDTDVYFTDSNEPASIHLVEPLRSDLDVNGNHAFYYYYLEDDVRFGVFNLLKAISLDETPHTTTVVDAHLSVVPVFDNTDEKSDFFKWLADEGILIKESEPTSSEAMGLEEHLKLWSDLVEHLNKFREEQSQ